MAVFALRQLAPQVGDVHIDRAIERRQAFTQHLLAKMLTRYHLAKMLRQKIEQGELGAGQFQGQTIEAGFLAAGVKA